MIQFQNEFVTIEVINDSTAILLTWKGFIPSVSYREGLDKSLEIAKKHKIKNWISDIRSMKVIGVNDQQWAISDWTPRAALSGFYQKQAVIMPEDIFGKAAASNLITTVQNQKLEIRNFTKLEEAKKWFEEVTVK